VDGGTGLRGDPGENGDLLASLGQLHERDSLITGPIDLQSRTLGGVHSARRAVRCPSKPFLIRRSVRPFGRQTVSPDRKFGRRDRRLSGRDLIQDHRLRRPCERRCILWDCPHLILQKAQERGCFVNGPEVQVDDDVAGIIDGLLDTLRSHTCLATRICKAVERRKPVLKIGDRVLDVQRGHSTSPFRLTRRAAALRKPGDPGAQNDGRPSDRSGYEKTFTLSPHVRHRTRRTQGIQLHFHRRSPHRGHCGSRSTRPSTPRRGSPEIDLQGLPVPVTTAHAEVPIGRAWQRSSADVLCARSVRGGQAQIGRSERLQAEDSRVTIR
jgi:hypothetical protein